MRLGVLLVLAIVVLGVAGQAAVAGAGLELAYSAGEGWASANVLVDGSLASSVRASIVVVDGVPVDVELVYREYCGGACPSVILVVNASTAPGRYETKSVVLSGVGYRMVGLEGMFPDVQVLGVENLVVVVVWGGETWSLDLAPLLAGDGRLRLDLQLGRDYFEVSVEEGITGVASFVVREDGRIIARGRVTAALDANGTARAVGVYYSPARLDYPGVLPVALLRVCSGGEVYTFNLTLGGRVALPGPVPEGEVGCLDLVIQRGVYSVVVDLAAEAGLDRIVLGGEPARVYEEAALNATVFEGMLLVSLEGSGVDPDDIVWAWAYCGGERIPGVPVDGVGVRGVAFPLPDGCESVEVRVESGTWEARRVVYSTVHVPEGVTGAGLEDVMVNYLVVSRENIDELSRIGAPGDAWRVIGQLGPGTSVLWVGHTFRAEAGIVLVEAVVSVEPEYPGDAWFSAYVVGGGGPWRVTVDWERMADGRYLVRVAAPFEDEVEGVYIVVMGGRLLDVEDVGARVYYVEPAGEGRPIELLLVSAAIAGTILLSRNTRLSPRRSPPGNHP